ncbi:hypothetical protein P8452_68627 [Trifolium repens]|nr:hypothetical protein P8452_68627 [Trifolium repens]
MSLIILVFLMKQTIMGMFLYFLLVLLGVLNRGTSKHHPILYPLHHFSTSPCMMTDLLMRLAALCRFSRKVLVQFNVCKLHQRPTNFFNVM